MDITAPLTLHFVRTVEGMAAGSDTRWTIPVASAAEAITVLGYYRNEDSTITVNAWADGKWVGTGRAGHGTVNHNLDIP